MEAARLQFKYFRTAIKNKYDRNQSGYFKTQEKGLTLACAWPVGRIYYFLRLSYLEKGQLAQKAVFDKVARGKRRNHVFLPFFLHLLSPFELFPFLTSLSFFFFPLSLSSLSSFSSKHEIGLYNPDRTLPPTYFTCQMLNF